MEGNVVQLQSIFQYLKLAKYELQLKYSCEFKKP